MLSIFRESLPTANFPTAASRLRKLAVSTFQLIAYRHTPDSKYLCSSRECLIPLSTRSPQPALWFQHPRISKRGDMQMPKSPGENSSGEAVTGGRERGSGERYYCSLGTGKLGRGKGRRESKDRKYIQCNSILRVTLTSARSYTGDGEPCRDAGLGLGTIHRGCVLERTPQVSTPINSASLLAKASLCCVF